MCGMVTDTAAGSFDVRWHLPSALYFRRHISANISPSPTITSSAPRLSGDACSSTGHHTAGAWSHLPNAASCSEGVTRTLRSMWAMRAGGLTAYPAGGSKRMPLIHEGCSVLLRLAVRAAWARLPWLTALAVPIGIIKVHLDATGEGIVMGGRGAHVVERDEVCGQVPQALGTAQVSACRCMSCQQRLLQEQAPMCQHALHPWVTMPPGGHPGRRPPARPPCHPPQRQRQQPRPRPRQPAPRQPQMPQLQRPSSAAGTACEHMSC